MTFNPKTWRPIAIVLSAVNLVAIGVTAGAPAHAIGHGALALAFGYWAERMRRPAAGTTEEREARLEALEDELTRMQDELGEAQERIDFAERMLGQAAEARRVDQGHRAQDHG